MKKKGKKIRHSYSARKQRGIGRIGPSSDLRPSHKAFALSQSTHKAYKKSHTISISITGDDAKMAETNEILPVYQPNSQGAFNAYKVRAVPYI